MSPQDTFSSRSSLIDIQTSQIWKDLQRDAVLINDEHIIGETHGTEAMVGALMRHIMDCVDTIRSLDEDPVTSFLDRDLVSSPVWSNVSPHFEITPPSTPRDTSQPEGPVSPGKYTCHQHPPRRHSRFLITEAQALACARDIFILCNRTQSGGDTFFTVNSLLSEQSHDLCIVTPLAADAEPLSVKVDIVRECLSASLSLDTNVACKTKIDGTGSCI